MPGNHEAASLATLSIAQPSPKKQNVDQSWHLVTLAVVLERRWWDADGMPMGDRWETEEPVGYLRTGGSRKRNRS